MEDGKREYAKCTKGFEVHRIEVYLSAQYTPQGIARAEQMNGTIKSGIGSLLI